MWPLCSATSIMRNNHGFSIIELLVVLVVVGVLAAMAVFAAANLWKYDTDNQARKIIDLCDEARQKALNQRTTYRVEINKTRNRLLLINENSADTSNDDLIVKSEPLVGGVTVAVKPDNVTDGPTMTSPVPQAQFRSSAYPLTSGDQKITMRFRRNGQVVDEGTDGIGTNSIVSGATIYLFASREGQSSPTDIRAVTVLGTTGDTSLFSCKFDSYNRCLVWKK